jgi:uncharacterized repeat protein (TIGR03943 family)
MSVSRTIQQFIKNFNRNWLDVIAVVAWGVLLLNYWIDGSLYVLIHPSYFWLVAVTGFALLAIGATKAYLLSRYPTAKSRPTGHVSLLPGNWAIGLLIITAVAGLFITPKVFTSSTAIQRGITENTITTRAQPQSFRSLAKPELRSLVDWVRTLSAYPEPDTYRDQKVNINGFVVQSPELTSQYILLSRFVITCCAADVYPVALTIHLPPGQTYPADSWLQIEGKMTTETLAGKRQLVVIAKTIKSIATPKNPYAY